MEALLPERGQIQISLPTLNTYGEAVVPIVFVTSIVVAVAAIDIDDPVAASLC